MMWLWHCSLGGRGGEGHQESFKVGAQREPVPPMRLGAQDQLKGTVFLHLELRGIEACGLGMALAWVVVWRSSSWA